MTADKNKDLIQFHDNIAEGYDDILSNNAFSEILRSIFQKRLLNNLPSESKILDLGCGTGEDALFLASKGFIVTGIDISEKMISIAKSKTLKKNMKENIIFFCCDMVQFIEKDTGNYDGIISNFNAVNYVKDMDSFAKSVSGLLNANGKIIFTVLNKICCSEILYSFITLRFSRAWCALFNRKKYILTELNLYFPCSFRKYFEKYFTIKKITGVGIIIPPHNLVGLYKRLSFAIPFLLKCEKLIVSLFPFYFLSDHYIIEMQKK